ncbi:MAG: virulence factor [Anaerolineales bacterium]|jgi:hypothetical protein
MANYKILYWHDIPSQIRVEDENGRVSKQLPARFQEAIDSAAMKAKAIEDDSYMAGFRWSEQMDRPGTAEIVAAQLFEEFDLNYPEIDWQRTAETIKNNPQ